ncbi:hypothetical protein P8452_26316 [Trifolium repens]|nr:hypothetical protein P8452_26316 [Trifolium repens]
MACPQKDGSHSVHSLFNKEVLNSEGEKEKEPESKCCGPVLPLKRKGYDLSNLAKVQKTEKSSSSSEKVESFVTSQKEQMTSENVNKEEQNANKICSQVESRKEYKNAIYHNNSGWPLDIHLKKFKDPSGK